ncbi:MAG: transketolase [Chloroflexi bacterium]|nr:transketolase [Chloroflexota bacterium]
MHDDRVVHQLVRQAAEMRLQIIRMMGADKVHHFGGSLSEVDIITALYFNKMRYNPADPGWRERDRFIMSKGHSVPAQYVALAMLGVFSRDELATLKKLGTRLQGHPAMHHTPGIEACTGALGEGLSYANGIALGGRLQGLHFRVYCLIGDGELHEGQVWEAAMTTAQRRLTNVVAIIDRNHLKAMDAPDGPKVLDPLAERWRTFGWTVREIDGHDMAAILDALDWAEQQTDRPALIIAYTIKGKGVSFIEGQAGYHNSAISAEQFTRAITELESNLHALVEA